MGSIIAKIGIKYNLNSYSDVLKVISPNLLGKITGIITTFYLISSASIILAGSGALINQFFGIPKIIGSLIMLCIACIFLLRDTEGLIEVNSFIVPALLMYNYFNFIFYIFYFVKIQFHYNISLALNLLKMEFLYLLYFMLDITYFAVQVY